MERGNGLLDLQKPAHLPVSHRWCLETSLNLDVLPGRAVWKGAEHVFYWSCFLVKRSYTQDISRFGSGMSLDMTLPKSYRDVWRKDANRSGGRVTSYSENFIINNHFMWVKWVVK